MVTAEDGTKVAIQDLRETVQRIEKTVNCLRQDLHAWQLRIVAEGYVSRKDCDERHQGTDGVIAALRIQQNRWQGSLKVLVPIGTMIVGALIGLISRWIP